jgi:amino acid transporter
VLEHTPGPAATLAQRPGLKRGALSLIEVVAQSVANIAPSATPALIIPLVFASAGNGTWLAYALATFSMLAVTVQINTFAARSASPGALYTFTAQGLGPVWGSISGWALFLAYVFTASATLCGFANYLLVLLQEYLGFPPHAWLVPAGMLLEIALCAWIAWRDITFSTRAMLLLEFGSAGLIVWLATVFLVHVPHRVDLEQLHPAGMTAHGLRLAMVLAIFSFVGFESATALGEEARNPLRSIPRSVLISVLVVGGFFTACAYVLVLAYRSVPTSLGDATAPLVDLAKVADRPHSAVLLVGAVLVGQFACTLASLNAAARVMYSMAQHGFFHAATGDAHEVHATPHIAVAVCSVVALVCPLTFVVLWRVAAMDVFGYFGSVATFGFLISYVLVSLAAPMFLHRRQELTRTSLVMAGVALVLLLIPAVGSVYPVPEPPYNRLPYYFLLLMLLGVARILHLRRRGLQVVIE